jgi:ABC-type nitrate/sulfonate/bicarbonate transport system substrate-binding protein
MNASMERRLVLKGALSVFATTGGLLGAPASWAQEAGKLSTLRSTSRSWLWSAEDYALQQKLFEKSGLAVELAATNRGVNQDALLSGAAEVLLGSPATNMRVQLQGRPIKMICGWVNKFASNVVVKKAIADKAGITERSAPDAKAAVLRGLRIGTTGPGSGPDQLTRYFMQRGKIDPDRDAQIVPVQGGPSAMLAAFERGQIDGFCLSSPASDVAIARFGGAYLFNMVTNPPPELNDFLYIVASVTDKTAKEKPKELAAYCRGIALALRSMAQDPASFKAFARDYFKDLDTALFEPVFANNIGMYMKTPVPTQQHFDINVEFLNAEYRQRKLPPIPATFKFDSAFDLRFVQQGMQGL